MARALLYELSQGVATRLNKGDNQMLQTASKRSARKKPLALRCATAREMMTANPISITAVSTLKRAAGFLIDHRFSAAPVIDDAGRAVGVISVTDIVRFAKKQLPPQPRRSEFFDNTWLELPGSHNIAFNGDGETEVRHVMTPMVFSVTPDTPARQVIDAMLAEHVHRLFVIDFAGLLVGVISTFDILKNVKP